MTQNQKNLIIAGVIIIAIVISTAYFLSFQPISKSFKKTVRPIIQNQIAPTSSPVDNENDESMTTIANPASVNCEKQGGRLQIESRPDGGQFGLCYFDDNRACEEWAMMRGECPIGGRKTTGYDTEAQKFCAWSGGDTLAEPNAVCKFKDGSTCLADDFYVGTCLKGEKK